MAMASARLKSQAGTQQAHEGVDHDGQESRDGDPYHTPRLTHRTQSTAPTATAVRSIRTIAADETPSPSSLRSRLVSRRSATWFGLTPAVSIQSIYARGRPSPVSGARGAQGSDPEEGRRRAARTP